MGRGLQIVFVTPVNTRNPPTISNVFGTYIKNTLNSDLYEQSIVIDNIPEKTSLLMYQSIYRTPNTLLLQNQSSLIYLG